MTIDEVIASCLSRDILGRTPLDLAGNIRTALKEAGYAVVPLADYARLVEASEMDDTIRRCETCNAWLADDDPARCTAEDYTGCWKIATGAGLCRHERGELLEVAMIAASQAEVGKNQDGEVKG